MTSARHRQGSRRTNRKIDRHQTESGTCTSLHDKNRNDVSQNGGHPGQGGFRKAGGIQKKVLEPEIARAKAGESVLLFMDGVHFVPMAFLGCLGCFTRIFIRRPSGRKRWNVLGAYNAISGQLTTVANDGYITATTVCEMLRKLADQYAGCPIVIVLDNARYQHCKLVTALAME